MQLNGNDFFRAKIINSLKSLEKPVFTNRFWTFLLVEDGSRRPLLVHANNPTRLRSRRRILGIWSGVPASSVATNSMRTILRHFDFEQPRLELNLRRT